MSSDKKTPIIKKIIKKGHGGGHSGSSWKVAYADFVTAMMAFFLVLWLLAISSEQGREALADYFNELSMSDAVFNGGLPSAFTEGGAKRPGIMEGGCFKPKSDGDATVAPEAENEAVQAQIMALLQASQKLMNNLENLPAGDEGGEGGGDAGRNDSLPGSPGEGDGAGGPLSPEQEAFKNELLAQVKGALGNTASAQVEVEKTKGGLRIQVMDQDGRPLFVLGGAKLTDLGRQLLLSVSDRLQATSNKISIEGHTDGLRMSGQKVTNWELSTARASAARIVLNQSGVSNDRLTAVTGYADTQPLPGTDPNDPQNRRISIMVWDEGSAPPPAPKSPLARPGQDAGAKRPEASQPTAGRPAATTAPSPTRPPAAKPQAPSKTRQQVESELIDHSMQRAATDHPSVGPPLPAKPPAEDWKK
jgi:chemotaxis protein MotB